MQGPHVGMNISRYLELKTKSAVEVKKVGKAFVIAMKKFDPDTGERLDDFVEAMDRKTVVDLRMDLLNKLAVIEELLADVDAANL